MVTDRIVEPSDALLIYAELAEDWLAEVVSCGRNTNAFPFKWGYSDCDVVALRDMMVHIRSIVAEVQQGKRDVVGWVDGKACPQRVKNLGSGVDARAGRTERGMLVRDHLGRLGIVLAQIQCPDRGWLALQRDERFRSMADGEWYKVICLSGVLLLLQARCYRCWDCLLGRMSTKHSGARMSSASGRSCGRWEHLEVWGLLIRTSHDVVDIAAALHIGGCEEAILRLMVACGVSVRAA